MKTQKKKIDNIDLLILDELQVNGKISNVELANLVNISPPSCQRTCIFSTKVKHLIFFLLNF